MSAVAGRTTTWRRNPRALARHAPGCVIVAGIGPETPLKLEGAAAFIWLVLDRPASEHDLIAAIAVAAESSSEAVESDVVAAVADLSALGVIEAADV
jgi:hypothetical protein